MDTQENTQSRYERCKNHLKENRRVYITGAVCLLAGVALAKRGDVKNGIQGAVIQIGNAEYNNKIITELAPRGNAGKGVLDPATGEMAASIRRMAEVKNISRAAVKKAIADGTYESLGEIK